jgi:hypothetical protein
MAINSIQEELKPHAPIGLEARFNLKQRLIKMYEQQRKNRKRRLRLIKLGLAVPYKKVKRKRKAYIPAK